MMNQPKHGKEQVMGTWDKLPWDNDAAADWFAELFEKTVPDIVLTPLVRRRSVWSFQPGFRRATANQVNACGYLPRDVTDR